MMASFNLRKNRRKTALVIIPLASLFLFALATETSAKVINLGTSTDSIFINGKLGVGISNPSVKLHLSDSADIMARVWSLSANGKATVQYLNNTMNYEAGIFSDQTYGINVGSTRGMTLDSSGNVGIGLTNPGAKLDINGNMVVKGAVGINRMASAGSTDISILNLSSASGSTTWHLGGSNSGNDTFMIWAPDLGAGKYLSINKSSGNVGIGTGTSSAATKLDVSGTLRNSLATTHSLLGGAGNVVVMADNTGTLYSGGALANYWSSNGTHIYNSNSGYVGIGTTSPTAKLHISGSGGWASAIRIDNTAGRNWSMYASGNIFTINDETAGANRIVLDQNGNVGIGVTNPTNRLDVQGGSARFAGGIVYFDNNESINLYGIRGRFNNQYIHLYNKVGIGDPSGWGNGESITPVYGLSTYGGANLAVNQGNVGIGLTNPSQKLDVNGNINVSGSINSNNSRTANYSTLTGASGDWFPLFTLNDSNVASVMVNLKTYAHSSVSFIVSRGYGASQRHSISVLNSIINANGGYANVSGLRVREDGTVEVQLVWTSGPGVIIGLQIMGSAETPTLVSSLNTSTSVSPVVDTVSLSNGVIRSRGGFDTVGTLRNSLSTTHSLLGGTGNVFVMADNSGTLYATTSASIINPIVTSASGWTANGTTVYKTDTNGNVGIGTTDPKNKLHVTGGVNIGTNYTGGLLNFQGDSATTIVRSVRSDNTQPGLIMYDGWNNYLFSNKVGIGTTTSLNGSTAALYVNGNVGIGTTNPNSKLNAVDGTVAELKFNSGASNLTPSLAVGNTGAGGKFASLIAGTNGAAFFYDDSGSFNIRSAPKSDYTNNSLGASGTNRLTIDSSGNVGIGTSSPGSFRLNVVPAVNSNGVYITNSGGNFNSLLVENNNSDYKGVLINHTSLRGSGGCGGDGCYGFKFDDKRVNNLTGVYGPSFIITRSGSTTISNLLQVDSHNVYGLAVTDAANVAIGATTTTVKLDVVGSLRNSAATTHSLLGGSGNAIVMTDNTGTLYSAATSTLGITNLWGGTLGGHIWNANSGNVGIGTPNPQAPLDLGGYSSNGSLKSVLGRMSEGDSNATGTSLAIRAWGTQTSQYNGKMFSLENSFYGFLNSSIEFYRGSGTTGGFMTFTTNNGSERMRIDSVGNVGIGTTNPASQLNIVSLSAIQNGAEQLRVTNGYSSDYITISMNDAVSKISHVENSGDAANGHGRLEFITNAAEGVNSTNSYGGFVFKGPSTTFLRILNNGNVGIGTTNPQSKLELNSTNPVLKISDISTGALGMIALGDVGSANNNVGVFRGAANSIITAGNFLNLGGYSGIVFTASNNILGSQTERMRIDSSGNVGIGITNPSSKLYVTGATGIINTGVTQFTALGGAGNRIVMVDNNGTLYQGSAFSSNYLVAQRNESAVNVNTLGDNFLLYGGSTASWLNRGPSGHNGGAILHIPTHPGDYYSDLWFDTANNRLYSRAVNAASIGGWSLLPKVSTSTANYLTKWSTIDSVTNSQLYDNGTSVGVGTSNLLAKFSVLGQDAHLFSGTGSNTLLIGRSASESLSILVDDVSATFESIQDENSTGYGNMVFRVDNDGTADGYFAFQNKAGSNFLRINSAGNVGIGTTNPIAKLDVSSNVSFNTGVASAKRYITSIIRTIGGTAGNYTYLGTINGTGQGTYATIYESHHHCGTINSATYEIKDVYYAGATTDWMQVPTHSYQSYSGVQDVAIDIRRSATGNDFELRIRNTGAGGVCGAGDASIEVQTNGGFTPSTTTGTGGTVAGYLASNVYQFPVSNDRFKASNEGLFILNSGNVGIGSTNPSSKLEVSLGLSANNATIRSLNTAGVVMNDASGNLYSVASSTFASALWNGTKNGNIWNGDTGAGNVGIGTSNPTLGKLQVLGTAVIDGMQNGGNGLYGYNGSGTHIFSMVRQDGAQNASLSLSAYGGIGFTGGKTSGNEATNYHMFINNSGNVGIGTTNPSSKLQIAGDVYLGSDNSVLTIYDDNIGLVKKSGDSGVWAVGANYVHRFGKWSTASLRGNVASGSFTEFLRIANNGNVGIGKTNPSVRLDVLNDISASGVITAGSNLCIQSSCLSTFNGIVKENTFPTLNGLTLNGPLTMASSTDDGRKINNVSKITVAVIDPLYSINGTKYSTYAASIAGGLKEEYVGKANLDSRNKATGEFEKVIDFDKVKEGTDLWVWRKVIKFNKESVEVAITPYGRLAQVYYIVDGNKLIFRSDKEVEISYRLIARRFDWMKWPTLAADQSEPTSLIIND